MTRELGPRSRRIHETLREQITSGALPSGSRLPSHIELAASYGVAPMTVRQVLALLEDEGLVSREQGRGTFVRRPAPRAVLIVEDDAQIGELLATIVRGSGQRPIVTAEIAAAHELLATDRAIALVLSDVRLPEAEDGIEFIRSVRRRYPELPVAAVTGFPGDLVALHDTPESPILILPKPFRPAQVREALQMALRLSL